MRKKGRGLLILKISQMTAVHPAEVRYHCTGSGTEGTVESRTVTGF